MSHHTIVLGPGREATVGTLWCGDGNVFMIGQLDSEIDDYPFHVVNLTDGMICETRYPTLAELVKGEGLEDKDLLAPITAWENELAAPYAWHCRRPARNQNDEA